MLTPLEADWENLERSYNDGSPSGFGLEHFKGTPYDPSALADFELLQVRCASRDVADFGEGAVVLAKLGFDRSAVPLHPLNPRRCPLGQNVGDAGVDVWPTSSGRTVVARANPGVHLKLDFNGTLGRTNRSITYPKAMQALAVWERLRKLRPPPGLHVFPEHGARIVGPPETSWGVIVRSAREWPSPEGLLSKVPLFALQSQRLSQALVSVLSPKTREELVTAVGTAALQLYGWLWTIAGLHVEFNAQNLLVLRDTDWCAKGVVVRDFGDIEFDLSAPAWVSSEPNVDAFAPYKIMARDHEQMLRRQRHSVAFDHKLSFYVLRPLLEALLPEPVSRQKTIAALRASAADVVAKLPGDFFPSGTRGWRYHSGLLTCDRSMMNDVTLWLRG